MADGDMAAPAPARLAVLRAVVERGRAADRYAFVAVASHAECAVVSTRGTRVGVARATGALRSHG